jgi:sugar lactone lactonase YvrE
MKGALMYFCIGFMAVQMPTTAAGQAIYTTPYTFTTLAGQPGVSGTNDGTGSAARFSGPYSLTVDSAGNAYVSDARNSIIRKVTPSGDVTTLAGLPGVRGTNDGTGSAARFGGPAGLAVDTSGNIYVADEFNSSIREVMPVGTNWVVTTVAGGIWGSRDGTNGDARFISPYGLAVDTNGILYVADSGNEVIRKITPQGTNWVVTTIAGTLANYQGSADGTNGDARFGYPVSVTVDANTNLYVADQENYTIRKVTPEGTNWVVTTPVGLAGSDIYVDGTNNNACFDNPLGVAVDADGNVYVANAYQVRKMTPVGTNWVVTTVAGAFNASGTNDGTGSNAVFDTLYGLTVDTNGVLYVADNQNNTIRKGYPPGSVPAPVLQTPGLSAGRFGFEISGLPNLAVDVQASSDLTNWQMADTNYYVLVKGTNYFPGPNPPPGNQFYRVRVR